MACPVQATPDDQEEDQRSRSEPLDFDGAEWDLTELLRSIVDTVSPTVRNAFKRLVVEAPAAVYAVVPHGGEEALATAVIEPLYLDLVENLAHPTSLQVNDGTSHKLTIITCVELT